MTPLPTVARQSERYNLSNTAEAAIVTATLIHYGLVSKDDLSMVVDAKKYTEHARSCLLYTSPSPRD